MPKINREEYEVLKELDEKGFSWITNTGSSKEPNCINAYAYEPTKVIDSNKKASITYSLQPDEDTVTIIKTENGNLFQFIQWEDESPYNIAELIEEYESEETEVKSKQELIEEWESAIEVAEFYGKGKEERLISYMRDFVDDLNQLVEPEVLTQEWLDNHTDKFVSSFDLRFVSTKDLQNLLVPKQEEVDQAYKDGYEKGKQHTFYKGYLEGLADKESEPETVADVLANFYKSLERLKEVLGTEVKEMEK